ncbi:hypothetical protein NDY24_10205 [Xanthomonas hortorum pv. pelargonii]|nr:hypothetical protein NDY24_10205 [Xanthomonas hortorum pv. pelargonii]
MTSNTGQLCGLTADYGNWLLRGGSKDLSGYLYGTWEFGNGVQAWTNLAVFDSEAQWGTSPPAVQLPAGLDFPAFYDVTSDQQLIGVRQFTAAEVGSQAGLRNRNRERSWDISAGLRGTLANGRFDWDASLGRSYHRVQERISTVNWQRANDYFLGPQRGSVDGLPAYALDRARWWTPLTPGQVRADWRALGQPRRLLGQPGCAQPKRHPGAGLGRADRIRRRGRSRAAGLPAQPRPARQCRLRSAERGPRRRRAHPLFGRPGVQRAADHHAHRHPGRSLRPLWQLQSL